jgi:large repetitive protein
VQARRSWIAVAAGLVALAIPASAAADPVLAANCPGPATGVINQPGASRAAQTFTAQTTGSLVRGEAEVDKFAMSTGDYVMQIASVDGSGTPTNTVLAHTAIPNGTVPAGISTIVGVFEAPAIVEAGQQYALVLTRSPAGFGWRLHEDNPCAGSSFSSVDQTSAWAEAMDVDRVFSVFVEPASQPAPSDSAPPNATIISGPKDKTRKKTATFEFGGTDTRAIASFQCSLDGEAPRACSSPVTYEVKKGKHTFQVRAIDQAGNVGSPAIDDWKLKRKRKG